MKFLLALIVFLVATTGAYSLQVVSTYPGADSGSFSTADTLRIVFDNIPPLPTGHNVVIHGTQAVYPIGWQQVRGDTLRIVPSHVWMVGDEIAVTVSTPYVNTAYEFSFMVQTPRGTLAEEWPGRTLDAGGRLPRAMTAVDLDGDGPAELVMLYTDAIAFARNVLYDDSCVGPCLPFDGVIQLLSPGPGVSDGNRVLRAGDLTGDGKPELVATTSAATR